MPMSPSEHTGHAKAARPGLRRSLALALMAIALLLIFAAYLQPDMAFQMAQQLWSCF